MGVLSQQQIIQLGQIIADETQVPKNECVEVWAVACIYVRYDCMVVFIFLMICTLGAYMLPFIILLIVPHPNVQCTSLSKL